MSELIRALAEKVRASVGYSPGRSDGRTPEVWVSVYFENCIVTAASRLDGRSQGRGLAVARDSLLSVVVEARREPGLLQLAVWQHWSMEAFESLVAGALRPLLTGLISRPSGQMPDRRMKRVCRLAGRPGH